MRLVTIGLAAGTLLVVGHDPADACSPPPCWAGYFTPATGATVPVNVPALYWQPLQDPQSSAAPDTQHVTLAATANPSVALAFTATPVTGSDAYLIVPSDPLVEGATYSLGDSTTCTALPDYPAAPTSVFIIGPSAAMPASLGAITITGGGVGALTVPTSSGSCTFDVQADRATLVLDMAADAMPWKDALHIETLVDGQRWDMTTLVYRTCASDDPGAATGVSAGAHELSMRATLPGTSLVLTTAPVSFTFDCSDAADPGDGDGDGDDGGCSTSGGGAWLAALAVVGLVRRRRR